MPPPSHPVDKRHDGPDSRHHAVKNTPHPIQGEKKIPLGGKQMRGVVVRHFVVSGPSAALSPLFWPFHSNRSQVTVRKTKSNRFFVSQSAFSPLLSAPSTAFRRYRDRC